MTVRIVTDSTSDITPALAQELGITVIPLTILFGEEAFLDGVELDHAHFYEKLRATKTLPRTSQPSPATYQEAYKRLIDEGADGIISAHLSSELSGTYQAAVSARDSLPEEYRKVPIEIIDSKSASLGISWPLFKAVEEAKQGHSLEEIKNTILDRYSRTHLIAILDTLEYIRRGGRIGNAKAMLGNMLSVKPLIALKDGVVVPLEQPRTRSKAFMRSVEIIKEQGPLEELMIIEANPEIGAQLEAVLQQNYPHPVQHYSLSGVLGAHTGPDTCGIVYATTKK